MWIFHYERELFIEGFYNNTSFSIQTVFKIAISFVLKFKKSKFIQTICICFSD